jgi:hypothetical protein
LFRYLNISPSIFPECKELNEPINERISHPLLKKFSFQGISTAHKTYPPSTLVENNLS